MGLIGLMARRSPKLDGGMGCSNAPLEGTTFWGEPKGEPPTDSSWQYELEFVNVWTGKANSTASSSLVIFY